ncbi:MAG: tripartite tricarboxylate transporter TctB family protein [Microvirga sp.]|nr:tripartite tricarboxylate transporter TctB family protein [Microvirga sp.]
MGNRRWLGRFAGELVVPLIMAAFLAAYWWQAAGLSSAAVTFPAALSVALVAMLLAQIAISLREPRTPDSEIVAEPAPARERFSAAAQRVGLLGLAAALFYFWRDLGGTLVVFLFTLGAFILLGERRWPLLVILPASLAIVLSYLFKVVLKVRFPDGLLAFF